MRVIDGNYELYQHLVRTGLAAEATSVLDRPSAQPADNRNGRDAERPASRAPAEKPSRPKRRFPYRKVADLEAEIFDREARVEQLHADMLQPEVLRDGRRVREIQAEIATQQESLQALYEHWEEATELNS